MADTAPATGTHPEPGAYPRPVLTVALYRDRPLQTGSRHVLLGVRAVTLGRGTAARRDAAGLHLGLTDERVSEQHARLDLERGRWLLTALPTTNGTRHNHTPVEAHGRRTLADGDIIELGGTFLVLRFDQPFRADHDPLDLDAAAPPLHPGWRTFHLPLAHLYREVARLASTRLPVLIQGPTGAGKERVAQGLHALSGRPGSLVAVNCANLAGDLAASQLFGHVRGAFTGATETHPGLLREASGGTLFLDELHHLPPTVQPRLLRVVETGLLRPLGASKDVEVDLRLVAATSRAEPGLPPDLYHRLAGHVLQLPPLDTRREDLGLILAELLGEPTTFDAEAARLLFTRPWPGNVRELRHALAAVPDRVRRGDLPPGPEPPEATRAEGKYPRAQVEDALHRARGDVAATAGLLGCPRTYVYSLLERHGLDPARYR